IHNSQFTIHNSQFTPSPVSRLPSPVSRLPSPVSRLPPSQQATQIRRNRLPVLLWQYAKRGHPHVRLYRLRMTYPAQEGLAVAWQHAGADGEAAAHVGEVRAQTSAGGCAAYLVAGAAAVGEECLGAALRQFTLRRRCLFCL